MTEAIFASGTTERVSVSSNGVQGNGHSFEGKLSGDGRYVAFFSDASNLVPNDVNNYGDCFVYDRVTHTVELVSIASDGTQGNNHPPREAPAISADGRYVAFASFASNLVSGDTNNDLDIFVHDRVTHTTERVSVTSAGTQASLSRANTSSFPAISADGRYVAFWSYAFNLAPGGTDGYADVYVHDRVNHTTERVSVTTTGTSGGLYGALDALPGSMFPARAPSISGDGQYVTFWTKTANLTTDSTNGKAHVYVRDRAAGTTELVSVASDGTQANDNSFFSVISADGRYVAFDSTANNLVPDDTNSHEDIFVHDRTIDTTERASVASDGSQANNGTQLPSISADGRYVVFSSLAGNLVIGDINSQWDIFIHDRAIGITERVSVANDGSEANIGATVASVSDDGRYVSFESESTNLVSGDTNGVSDVFVHDQQGVPDTTAPVINITSPVNTTYNRGQIIVAQYTCADSESGVATCTGSVANGSPIDTSSTGTKIFTVTATDNAGNNTSQTVTYTVATTPGGSPSADLAISLTSDAPNRGVVSGSNITYTITVQNKGPNIADGVTVGDDIPVGTTFVSASTSQGSYNLVPGPTGNRLVASLGTLANGSSATVTLVVQVTASRGSTINNAAGVMANTFDPINANNGAAKSTKVR